MLTPIEIESSSLLLMASAMLREGACVDRSAAKVLSGKLLDCAGRAEAAGLHYMADRLNDAAARLRR